MPLYDIIIPTHDNEEITLRCLDSIKESSTDYNVVWVDNRSTRSLRHKVLERLRHIPHTCSWLITNEGFVKAVNHGLSISRSQYAVILHNDCVVTPGWLERLEYPLKRDQLIMCSGAMSDDPEHWQGWKQVKSSMFNDMPDFDVKDPLMASKLAEDRFKYQYKQVKSLSFFCAMVRRTAFGECGLLDEDFDMGMMADEAFCSLLGAKNHKIVFCPSAFVFHKSGTTFNKLFNVGDMAKAGERNKMLFKRKYPICDK